MISRTLLTIAARGNAIITELNRLYELVPAVFLAAAAANDQQRVEYLDRDKKFTINDLICDFSYFKITESFEAKIDSSDALKWADEEFCNNYIDILTRFYLTFESVQRYASDLNNFVQEIDDDLHVGQSFDNLLSDVENRQLLCESYFLLGHMLLTIDNYFESSLRERIIVSYYRYSSYKSSPSSYLDETCNLMRSTGFLRAESQKAAAIVGKSSSKNFRPEGYPESFFARVGVNSTLVSQLVGKLLSVDIYNQTMLTFPNPDHRSTALATQASMLYVILFFCPSILHMQRSKMREITDKFFYDNWVTSISMGDLVNLIEAWNPYKAARESLVQLLDLDSTRALTEHHRSKFERAARQMRDYLKEGWLDEDRVLEHHARILTLIRESNIILRWFLLHSHSESDWQLKLSKSVHSLVVQFRPSDKELYMFLQNLAEIEKKFLFVYEDLLKRQEPMVGEGRLRTIETLNELIAIFNDPIPMRYIQPGSHTKLASHLAELVTSLKSATGVDFGRELIISVINQLGQLQDQYSDGKNLQVVQLFKETRDSLLQALRALGLIPDIGVILHSIGDFSYAWKIVLANRVFTPQMQQIIKENPLQIQGIGATFLKLTSAFDASLIRIQQVNSKLDLLSVSKYYSTKLMLHIRDVLHVIPATILELLGDIIDIQTECVMGDLPAKISLDKLRDYALPEKRFRMLQLTHKVSHYAESLMLMQNTVIGVIQVDSRSLLEDGFRRELVRRVSDSIREILSPAETTASSSNSSVLQLANSLLSRLVRLDEVMGGFKRSLEYVQDYLFIYGLRMWQEELSRIVRFNVDTASSALRGKNHLRELRAADNLSSGSQSAGGEQRHKISVPVYHSNPLKSSFVVMILDELLRITDPRATIYDEQMSAWYEQRAAHDRVVDLRVFELIGSSLGLVGLNGLDELCSCLLMLELQRLDELLSSISNVQTNNNKHLLDSLESIAELRGNNRGQQPLAPLLSSSSTSNNKKHTQASTGKVYAHALKQLAPHSERIANHLSSIGQLQLIRQSIGCVLSTRSRCEARDLYSCLDTLNSSLLATLRSSAASSQHKTAADNQQQQQRGAEATETPATSSKIDDDPDEDTCRRAVNRDDDAGVAAEAAAVEQPGLDLQESQLIFELTNHLEWVGLSDPLSKIYTLSLQSAAPSSPQANEFRRKLLAVDLMFLLLLEHCSGKLLFSKLISGFLPVKQTRSAGFLDSQQQLATDGAPLFYGLVTLLNHYQPFVSIDNRLEAEAEAESPFYHLLEQMAFYIKCSFVPPAAASLKPHELTLDSVNMVLSMIELIRLARLPVGETLSRTQLPQFVYDTFQFVVCQLGEQRPPP